MKKVVYSIAAVLLCCSTVRSEAQTADASIAPHLNHIAVYVKDLKTSTDFYKNVMLLKEIPEPFHDNKHTWFSIGNHAQLHVIEGAKAVNPHDINVHNSFSVGSLQAFMKHLDALHIKYGNWQGEQGKTQARPDKVQQIYLQDPDGYWIEVNDDRF
jgi:lactoylglutathione lyase